MFKRERDKRMKKTMRVLWSLLMFFVTGGIATVYSISVGMRITRKRRKTLSILELVSRQILRNDTAEEDHLGRTLEAWKVSRGSISYM